MINVSLDDVKHNLPIYLKYAENGETIIITRDNKPIFELKPIKSNFNKETRPFGLCYGEFTVPDNFDDPLPEYIIEEFKGK